MGAGQTFLELTTTALEVKGLSVSSSVKTLSDFGFSTTNTGNAKRAIISAVTDGVMATWDGSTAPTSTLGHPIPVNQTVTVQGNRNINNLKLIRVTTDANVTITLES